MAGEDLRARTRHFGLRVIHLVESLPRRRTADLIGGQLLRAGTSVGSNYRAACRAKSPADFISKMGTVEEELDESLYWMEMLLDSRMVQADGTRRGAWQGVERCAVALSFRIPQSAFRIGGGHGRLG